MPPASNPLKLQADIPTPPRTRLRPCSGEIAANEPSRNGARKFNFLELIAVAIRAYLRIRVFLRKGMTMAAAALALYVAFGVLALGCRCWIQWHRTGSTG